MAEDQKKLVMRYQFESYMKCTLDDNKDKLCLIGEGFTSFPESKNPAEYTRKYICDQTERSDVIGYAPSIEYSTDCISGDPVVAEILYVHDNELVGSDTHRDVVNVNRWKEKEGKCPAKMRTYAIIPNQKADGTDALVYTGTMKAVSDIVDGTFDVKTSTFEAASPGE